MEVSRVYYSAGGDVLRVDVLTVDVTQKPAAMNPRVGNDPGLQMKVGPRNMKTTMVASGGIYAAQDRDVSTIEVSGDYTAWDSSAPPGDILWVTKTLGNGQVVKIDMSDLPRTGDTV